MPNWAGRGLLAFTGGLAGLGAGLSTAARDYAQYAGRMDMEAERNRWDLEKVKLADSLALKRDQMKMDFEREQNQIKMKHDMDMQGQRLSSEFDKAKMVGGFGLLDTEKRLASEEKLTDKRIASEELRQDKDIGLRKEEGAAERQLKVDLQDKQIQSSLLELDKQIGAAKDQQDRELGFRKWDRELTEKGLDDRQKENLASQLMNSREQREADYGRTLMQMQEQRKAMREEYGFKKNMQLSEIISKESMANADRMQALTIANLHESGQTLRTNITQDAETLRQRDRLAADRSNLEFSEEREDARLDARMRHDVNLQTAQHEQEALRQREQLDAEMARTQVTTGAGLLAEGMRDRRERDLAADKNAMDKYAVEMQATNNTLLKAMDQNEVKDFVTDREGRLQIITKSGRVIDPAIYSPDGKPIMLPPGGDKNDIAKVLAPALLKHMNLLNDRLVKGEYDDREMLMDEMADTTNLFQHLYGVKITEEPGWNTEGAFAPRDDRRTSSGGRPSRNNSTPDEGGLSWGDVFMGVLPGQQNRFAPLFSQGSGAVNAQGR